MRCGEAILRRLEEFGATTLFGIPGVHTLEFYRGLAGTRMRSVLTRHEQGASFMADGYARVTGLPAICCVISGPGVTNAATGVGQAYADSVPMFVLASGSRRDTEGRGRGHLHECKEQRLIMEPITALALRAEHQQQLPLMLAQLWSTMMSGRRRPVYLEVPVDLLAEEVDGDWPFVAPDVDVPTAVPEAITRAAAALRAATSPLIIVGGGARSAGAEIRRLAERIGAPVINTVAGKGVFPDAHPLSAGQVMKRPAVQQLIAKRDVVLAVGTELGPTDTNHDQLPIDGTLIRIDLDEQLLPGGYPEALCLRADAGDALRRILAELGAGEKDQRRGQRDASVMRELAEAAAPPYRPWHREILTAVFDGLRGDEIVFSDMTQIAYSATQIVPLAPPARWNHPTGFGTLGYGLPAAIGAAVADGEHPIVVFAGDGGVMYTIAELATAVERDLDVTLVIWNNSALGQIRDDMGARGIDHRDVTPQAPDFVQLALALGARAQAPQTIQEISSAMTAARGGGPVVVVLDERVLAADPARESSAAGADAMAPAEEGIRA